MRGIALALLLAGCAEVNAGAGAATNYLAGQSRAAAANVRAANDAAATAWAELGCATPYGEVARNGTGNPRFAAAIVELCGPPAGFALVRTHMETAQ
jgi:hypothetical protein